MRTTLTLDDDVAAQLQQLRRGSDVPLKQVVNDALRQGLRQLAEAPKARRQPFRTGGLDLGPAKIPLDNVAEALALAEGDDFR